MDDAGKHQHYNPSGIASPSKEAYKKSLASNYSVQNGGENGDHLNSKILAFKSKAPAPPSAWRTRRARSIPRIISEF